VHSRPIKDVIKAINIQGDIRDTKSLTQLMKTFKPEILVHLAAETGTGQSYFDPMLHTGTNVDGTASIIKAIADSGTSLEYIILSSSRAIYGEGAYRTQDEKVVYPNGRTTFQFETKLWEYEQLSYMDANAEITIANPTSIYGSTKYTQELLLKNWAIPNSVPIGIFRLQNVYGLGQDANNPYTGILNIFIKQSLRGESIELYEDGQATRDFIYIDDVAEVMLQAISKKINGTFDVGTGKRTSLMEVGDTIAAALKSAPPFISGKYRIGDVRHASCDSSFTRNTLGRDPIPLNQGLDKLLSWLKNGTQ
jgi:dTDP-L-rhamnose 4-epimerase